MNKRTVRAWALYDFANSIYPAVVTTAVFSRFYVDTIVAGEGGEGELWWGWAVATSALIVAFCSPFLGAIADRAGVRKKFFAFYVVVCLAGVTLMTTLEPGMVVAGFLMFVMANVGFESANVFYNSYLPDIAPVTHHGRVSGLGFGLGYLGSAIGLIMALLILQVDFASLGGWLAWVPPLLDAVPFRLEPIQVVWISVVTFFLVFSIPAFRRLPADQPGAVSVIQAAREGFANTKRTIAEVWRNQELRTMRDFLFAFFFYIDGVLTIIVMAGVVAGETFGFTTQGVIVLFLIVQFSALIGAFALARPTDSAGPKKVLLGVLMLWTAAGLSAYFIQGQTAFYVVAIVAGFGLGAVQSASRAYMAALIPDGREAEMFGFYALCGRSSSVLGPLLFGGTVYLAGGNQRPGFLVLTVLFVIGALLLRRVADPKAVKAG